MLLSTRQNNATINSSVGMRPSSMLRPRHPQHRGDACPRQALAPVVIYREADGVHGAQEDRDGASSVAGTTTPGQPPARAAPHGTGAGAPPAAAPGGDGAAPAGLGQPGADRAGTPPAGAAADCPGGGA